VPTLGTYRILHIGNGRHNIGGNFNEADAMLAELDKVGDGALGALSQ
jgi:hypothetical protein